MALYWTAIRGIPSPQEKNCGNWLRTSRSRSQDIFSVEKLSDIACPINILKELITNMLSGAAKVFLSAAPVIFGEPFGDSNPESRIWCSSTQLQLSPKVCSLTSGPCVFKERNGKEKSLDISPIPLFKKQILLIQFWILILYTLS